MNTKISRTVYSIAPPQTHRLFDDFRTSFGLGDRFKDTWTKKQDDMHTPLFESWLQWVQPRLQLNQSQFSYRYPTNGSSEAIREQIVFLASKGKRLVVFYGEYEGYEMIAQSVGMPVLKISRNDISQLVLALSTLNVENDVFFLSEPSAIDGNRWDGFTAFMATTQRLGVKVYLDVTYVGATGWHAPYVLNYQNIDGIFFSLSKIFGVYYHRIGGVLLKEANPLLYGNMWFKNLFAIGFGVHLFTHTNIDDMSKPLLKYQNEAIKALNYEYGYDLQASNVSLLATVEATGAAWQKEFVRDSSAPKVRVCLSPTLETLMYASKP